jgi:hypothetical protein
MLGCPTQDVEGLVGSDALALHQDALGLTDELAGGQGLVQVDGPPVLVFVGASSAQGQPGKGGEESTSLQEAGDDVDNQCNDNGAEQVGEHRMN